jgi:ATP-dependent Clp protease ATP-binding subunit ClpA
VSERLDIRRVVAQARDEARSLGGPRIEAEHLLLAMTAHPQTAAGQLLVQEGLDHSALRTALDREFEHSLAAVGVRLDDFTLPAARGALAGEPRYLGQSAKLALQRALKLRAGRGRNRRLGSLHLLLGIVSAPRGTAVRALDAGEVDRAALVAKLNAVLARQS